MSNAEETITVLQNLKALGIQISIDDFGTGYSSLAYLKRFPIDKLKIDIAFVREVTSNPDDAAIVLAIINMAHSMKLEVIAEGDEKDAQLAYLRRHGCDEMQGYYFSRPLPELEFEAMLKEGKSLQTPVDETVLDQQTLLIVDDDAFMLEVLTDFLAQDGYRILTAQTAAEGFDILARHRVQVILRPVHAADERDGVHGARQEPGAGHLPHHAVGVCGPDAYHGRHQPRRHRPLLYQAVEGRGPAR